LVSEDEARHTVELEDRFVVQPSGALWFGHDWENAGRALAEGFRYGSDTNPIWMTETEMQGLVASLPPDAAVPEG
jgi:UDP-N-acetylglucosamine 4,6-dehydratase